MNQTAVLESVLFAAGEPVRLSELASLLAVSKPHLVKLLDELEARLQSGGTRLVRDSRTAQLVTAPEAAPHLSRFLQAELRGKLSAGALETLAIIAYRGPVTRPQIESIRGVQSSAPLRTLAIRGLIEEVGRAKEPGKPYRYDITLELYKHLGVQNRDELPKVPEDLAAKLSRRKV